MTEQALQTYLQSEDAQRTTQGTLVSEVTLAWLTLGANREQLALQKETLASQEESFRLVGESYKYGAASRLDYEQARTTVASARAAITTYVRAVAQSKNALELLVGSKVPDELQPSGVELAATLPATMPAGLPSEVLLNRPDIISAERGMISANANIGAARAAFFPSISLTANAGSASAHLSDLFGANTGLWSFTPSISIPIFTGGRNLANLRSAEVQEKIAVATYERAFRRLSKKSPMPLRLKVRSSGSSKNAVNLRMRLHRPLNFPVLVTNTVLRPIQRSLMLSVPRYLLSRL